MGNRIRCEGLLYSVEGGRRGSLLVNIHVRKLGELGLKVKGQMLTRSSTENPTPSRIKLKAIE